MQQLQNIVIGDPQDPSFTFEGDDIMSTSGDFSVDMIGAELCTDVMETEVSYDDTNGTLRALPWAMPVYFYRGEHLEGKLYSVSVTRTGRKAYRIRTTSAAGILEYDTFYGNMYTGETFKAVVEQIIGTNALQPYDGIYRHLIREYYDWDYILSSYGMGKYADQAKTQEDVYGCFMTATMASKLSAKIKINGFSNQLYDKYISLQLITPTTTYRCSLLGACAAADASANLKKFQYGLYMQMTRASTNDPFPAFGEVFFVYGNTEISLGTPSSTDDAVYEIDVNPGAGTAVINGVTHLITLDNTVANEAAALHVYGGGADLLISSGSIVASGRYPNCEFEIFYYTVKSSSNATQADYVAVRNMFTGQVGIYDCVSHKYVKRLPCASVPISEWEPYDISTYGMSLLFNNRTDFQTEVLTSLTYAAGIDEIKIYGWLPICSKRQALQQLLFATGVILIKDENGAMLFTAPSAQSVENIDENDVYDKGSEEQPEHVNTIELTEHSFILDTSSQAQTIYENITESVGGYFIAPFTTAPAKSAMDEIHYSGYLNCVYANCNAALVSGTGKFAGRPYQHEEKMLRREIANYPDGHGVSVSDATLVTLLNSESVLDRLEAYYVSTHKTRVDISQNGERCGLMYSLTSAFGEAFSGFLVRANKVITSIVKAACEFVVGYTPPEIEGGYRNYVILTGSSTWTVPASVFEKETPRIHVVLIGGGDGGDGGYAGEDGMQPEAGEGATPAEGGAPGDSGSGGKIFEVTITNPAGSYAYNCGQGGAGGAISNSHDANNPGSVGGNTVISGGGLSYSSANGASKENGIANSITGDRYAGRMIRQISNTSLGDGGSGGYRSAESYGSLYHGAIDCWKYIMNEFLDVWWGGQEGAEYRSDGWLHASGGGGGGAGYGQDGFAGSAASYSDGVYRSGNGGKGGDATETPPKATDYNPAYYGYGGLGGGGGGGGGAGGWVLYDTAEYAVGTGGAGGYGGRGGDGGDGCVLIYY